MGGIVLRYFVSGVRCTGTDHSSEVVADLVYVRKTGEAIDVDNGVGPLVERLWVFHDVTDGRHQDNREACTRRSSVKKCTVVSRNARG